jgi:hypothetical protein
MLGRSGLLAGSHLPGSLSFLTFVFFRVQQEYWERDYVFTPELAIGVGVIAVLVSWWPSRVVANHV